MKTKLLLSLFVWLCCTAVHAYDFMYNQLCYKITDSENLEVEVEKGAPCEAIPSTVSFNGKSYTVTSIGKEAFQNCNYLVSITIPNTVRSIGYSAFSSCTNLHDVVLGDGLEEIGYYAFASSTPLYIVSHSINPPSATILQEGPHGIEAIFVPDGSVEAYKKSDESCWNEYNIMPMSKFASWKHKREIVSADIPMGVYFLKNVDTGKYLNRGNIWGYHAVLDTEGLPALVEKQDDGSYTITFNQGSRHLNQLFRDDEQNVYVDYNGQENGCPFWTITNTGTDGTYYIQTLVTHETFGQDAMPGTYLGNNPFKEAVDQDGNALGVYNDVDGNVTNTQGMNILWQLVPESEYISHSQTIRLEQLVELAKKLGINTNDAEKLLANSNATGEQITNAINTLKSIIIGKLWEGVDETVLPLDLTCLVENPSFDQNNADGWEGEEPLFQVYDNAEFFESTFDFHQTVKGLPDGNYQLKVKGFHRPGTNQDVYTDYRTGKNKARAVFYANDASATLENQARFANVENQARFANDWEYGDAVQVTYDGDTLWVPNSMRGARCWFDGGCYENELVTTVNSGKLTFGIRLDETCARGWVIFDDFRVIYWGNSVVSGTYYLYNPASGKYLCSGNDWGTRASLSDHGLDVELTRQANGGYFIDTRIYLDEGSHYLGIDDGNTWCDRPEEPWILTDKGDGTITLTTDLNRYLAFDGTTALGWSNDPDDNNARWELVTRDDLMKQLSAASNASPVDATFLLPAANFLRNDQRNSEWQGEPVVGGDYGNMCAEKFNTTFDIWQEINVPNGTYKVNMQGFYREGAGDEDWAVDAIIALHRSGGEHFYAKFYANEVSTSLKSIFDDAGHHGDEGVSTPWGYMPNTMAEASNYFSAGLYENELPSVKVTKGKLLIGVKKDVAVDKDWTIFDNFRLTYFGNPKKGDVNVDGTVDVADIAYVISAMAGSLGANKDQADVNNDGVVDVADIAFIIDVMAGK